MMEKMNNIFILSLKEIALRRIPVILLCHFTDELFIDYVDNKVNVKIKDNVSKLLLPSSLKEQIKYLVKPVITEIRDWISFHHNYFHISVKSFDGDFLRKLCWTVLGSVDYRKTAEYMICLELFDTVTLYKLACEYCLDDYIPILWENLSEEKKNFYTQKITYPELAYCWPYIIQGETNKLDYMPEDLLGEPTTFNQHAFEYSACCSNVSATEYFFRKLTDEERDGSLFRTTKAVLEKKYNCFSSFYPRNAKYTVLCYLLSKMSSEMQMEIFKENSCIILGCFLFWPCQHLFLEVVELIWTFLPEDDYKSLLWNIGIDIRRSGYYNPKLLQEFFLRAPTKIIVDFVWVLEADRYELFLEICKAEDLETVKVILKKLDSYHRTMLITCLGVLDVFFVAVSIGNCHFVESCLEEAKLSKGEKQELKRKFCMRYPVALNNSEYEQFFCFLDETDQNTSIEGNSVKDNLTEGNCNSE